MTAPMQPLSDPKSVAQAGFDALQRGKNQEALTLFSRLAAVGQADGSVFFATAIAWQRLGDLAAARQAIDEALALDGTNFQCLLFKADLLAAAGQHKDASAFYLAAVRTAAKHDGLAPALMQEVERAKRLCDNYAAGLEHRIREALAPAALAGEPPPARIADALDILFGHKTPYVQQPRYFFFPGLAARQFFAPNDFDWIPALEASTDAIRQELREVMHDQAAFKPYVEGRVGRPHVANTQDEMLNNPDWSAFYLWKNGHLVPENAARCPQTVKAMQSVPLTRLANRSPSVLFSLLRSGAHISPHNGLINTRLIVHLPLIVPGKCRLRVGNETREWVPGKVWLFDDTIEHEAWNDSSETRVILLFEVNRPDISAQEHQLIGQIFDAIDAHASSAPEWEI